ncbi:hypothetical protein V5799_010175 [Amblyomma americanum]|uniref:Uncharacterized protein n=1 Tax=Amblyomma americanum TaxID=6943 RepID=A0AAQ4F9Z8_AMBAM
MWRGGPASSAQLDSYTAAPISPVSEARRHRECRRWRRLSSMKSFGRYGSSSRCSERASNDCPPQGLKSATRSTLGKKKLREV